MNRRSFLTTSVVSALGYPALPRLSGNQSQTSTKITAQFGAPRGRLNALTFDDAGALWSTHNESDGDNVYKLGSNGSVQNSFTFEGVVKPRFFGLADHGDRMLGLAVETTGPSDETRWAIHSFTKAGEQLNRTRIDVGSSRGLVSLGDQLIMCIDDNLAVIDADGSIERGLGVSVDAQDLATDGDTVFAHRNGMITEWSRSGRRRGMFVPPAEVIEQGPHAIGHDGEHLYLGADNVVYKLDPEAIRYSPEADVVANRRTATAGDVVEFDASGSRDRLNDIQEYQWDFDGDGVFEQTTSDPAVSYRYERAGDYEATLKIRNENGQSDSATVEIAVDEPAQTSTEPAAPTETPTAEDGPGFGMLSGVAGFGGALLLSKYTSNDSEDRQE